jgi:hypothetical protein
MRRTEPGPERDRLGFAPAVVEAFAFLEEEYGFRRVATLVTYVRYESPKVFVNVFHGRASYELGVELGLRGPDPRQEDHYSLHEFLRFAAPPVSSQYKPFQVTRPETVATFVPVLADLLKSHAGPALVGDEKFFSELQAAVSRDRRALGTEMRLGAIRDRAVEAWQLKEYARFVSLLAPVEPDLTDLERRKLAYARRRLQRNGAVRQ